MPDALLSVEETAQQLHRRPREVFDLIKAGLLAIEVHDQQVFVTAASVREALDDGTHLLGFAQLRRDLDAHGWGHGPVLPEPAPDIDTIDVLDQEGYRLRAPADALIMAGCVSRQEAGTHLFLALDRAGRVEVFLPVEGDPPIAETVGRLAFFGLPRESMLVISNRTGEEPADRPGDELEWECARGAAEEHGVRLLDWWIVWGTALFSAAEFAPSGPGWPTGSLDDTGLPRVHPNRRTKPPA